MKKAVIVVGKVSLDFVIAYTLWVFGAIAALLLTAIAIEILKEL